MIIADVDFLICFTIIVNWQLLHKGGEKTHSAAADYGFEVNPSNIHANMWCDQAKSVGSRKYWFWDIAKQSKYFLLFPFVLETL